MTRFFEHFAVGDTLTFGDVTVTERDIIAFAEVFDAQDFHIDAGKAKDSFVGGLIGSGWHTSALMMRMMCEGFLIDSTGMGAPGIEELRWLAPVKPGDRLSMRYEVLETKASRSRPDIGLVRFAFEVVNQADVVVQKASNWIIFGREGVVAPPAYKITPGLPSRYVAPRPAPALTPPGKPLLQADRFDDLVIGERADLGAFTFTGDDIMAFARAFDQQRFHLDRDAAKASLFGGLCASGWHTGAVWMRLMVAHRRRIEAVMGSAMPKLGPSPGFKNLRWLKPVFEGDTISFATTTTDKRLTASRPGWGLAFHRNEGTNQNGELVFAFDGCVFWER